MKIPAHTYIDVLKSFESDAIAIFKKPMKKKIVHPQIPPVTIYINHQQPTLHNRCMFSSVTFGFSLKKKVRDIILYILRLAYYNGLCENRNSCG